MQKKYYYALLAYLLVPLAGISTDIYLPSLPHMAKDFAVTKALVQLTVTTYVTAMAMAQLLAGPISDAYGRKKQIIFALLTQLIAILFIVIAGNMQQIIIARFFQGLGGGFMIVPARAILNDVFTGKELKKHFNYLTISFSLGPIIGPFMGGYAEHYFGWQASFYFVFAYCLVLLGLATFTYNETLSIRVNFSLQHLWKNYIQLLGSKLFVSFTLFVSILFGYTSIFSVSGPFIFQNTLHLNAINYGYIALIAGFAWFAGNMTNRFLFHVKASKKISFALNFCCVTLTINLILNAMNYLNVYVATIPAYIVIYFTGMIFPIFVGECLSLFPTLAASANACFFAMTWFAFSIYSLIATALKPHSLLPVGLSFFAINVLTQIIYWLSIRKKLS